MATGRIWTLPGPERQRMMAKCHPDELLEAAARALVEQGLHQRRLSGKEWRERRSVKGLEDQLDRISYMFHKQHITRTKYDQWRTDVEKELAEVRELPIEPETGQRSVRLTDLVAAWRDANPDQRARLAASITVEIQVEKARMTAVRPRPAWAPYFEELLQGVAFLERETRVSRAVSAPLLPIRFSFRLADLA